MAWSVVVGYVRLVCRLAAVVAIGLAANWGFLAMIAWQFGTSPRVTYSLAILVAFGVLFPIGYLIAGQKQGVQVLLRHCYERHAVSLIDFLLLILHRLVTAADASPNAINTRNLRIALQRVDEMPWPVRFALRRYLDQDELQALALEIIGDSDFKAGRQAATKERYASRIHKCILSTMLDVDKRWLRVLAAVNACAAAAVWLLLR